MKYICPECSEASPVEEWVESSVACEDCGEHPALVCPRCDEPNDEVMNLLEEVE